MALKDKLKLLRNKEKMTQDAVAEQLGVSSQTVSKWERGLLSPDILLLPKIARLFHCSIDSLFDMNDSWDTKHRQEFEKRIHELHAKKDWNGVYDAWIAEIETDPDRFGNYLDVMNVVLRRNLFDDERVLKMLSLADRADKLCQSDDIRHAIYSKMLLICAKSPNEKIKSRTLEFYQKIPSVRDNREFYASFVMEGEALQQQKKRNVVQMVDFADTAVRALVLPDMKAEEKLYYYKKAAAFYEILLDGKYGGFYDTPLLEDYAWIVLLSRELKRYDEADEYMNRILLIIEKHLFPEKQEEVSKLLLATKHPDPYVKNENICKIFLKRMLDEPAPGFEKGAL